MKKKWRTEEQSGRAASRVDLRSQLAESLAHQSKGNSAPSSTSHLVSGALALPLLGVSFSLRCAPLRLHSYILELIKEMFLFKINYRSDKTMQEIVYKLVPRLARRELRSAKKAAASARRQKFISSARSSSEMRDASRVKIVRDAKAVKQTAIPT